MSLPNLIEIVPLDKPVRAEITVPGSKSITNRALILAAWAEGTVTLRGALWSEDTQIMVECLQQLGFDVRVADDPAEFCNRTITVHGLGGNIPKAGTEAQPLELFVGNAGTAARFLSAFLCLGRGVYRLHGVPRMHERPQAALFQALRELGYRVESEASNDKLPVRIYGEGPKPGACGVSVEESSQFASALLLCMCKGGWEVGIMDSNPEELPYVEMTSKMINAFPQNGGNFQIEPDASSGSYFWAAGWLLAERIEDRMEKFRKTRQTMADNPDHTSTASLHKLFQNEFSHIRVKNWPDSHWQPDDEFKIFVSGPLEIPTSVSRLHDLADSIMTVITLAPLNGGAVECVKFTDLGRLRVQECERVVALRTELTKCGAKVVEEGDTLTVWPSTLHGAEIETYNDHRMAMCFAVLGLKVPGIKIKNPACVKKTFPNFFQKLAGPQPHGLGATILDGNTGRKLELTELFAD